jgi:serine/threonine protein kinase
MVLDYAEGKDLDYWVKKNHKGFDWLIKIKALSGIIQGLNEIHQKQIVHHDFHTGNILASITTLNLHSNSIYISDMGLCGEAGITDETKIYGATPYVAPEVLRRNSYTQAADIYSFGMIMYFVATGKQPFANCAKDEFLVLVLDICKGVRPEINELEAPKCYIDLMKKCWDPNPDNRPRATEICKMIDLFHISYLYDKSDFKRYIKIEKGQQHFDIEKQFKEAEKNRKSKLFDNNNNYNDNDDDDNSRPQSQLLNPLLSKISECFDCEITD